MPPQWEYLREAKCIFALLLITPPPCWMREQVGISWRHNHSFWGGQLSSLHAESARAVAQGSRLIIISVYPYIDTFQSMTIFFVIDHGQWQFFCHWPGSMTLFWALSISFCHWLWSMTYGHKWYVHKVECFSALSNSQWDHWAAKNCHWPVNDKSLR